MIKSMTGYGKASGDYKDKKVSVEIKTLNSKTLDLYVRLLSIYKEKEIEARKFVASKLERGKVELGIQVESIGGKLKSEINHELVQQYYKELRQMNENGINQENVDYMSLIMRMPDIFVSKSEDLEEEEWNFIMKLLVEAVTKVDQFRIDEGKSLEDDLKLRISNIRALLEQVDPHEISRIEIIKDRMKKSLSENFKGEKTDENRFEQELIYYIEKIDISEEKVRLANHLNYFDENMTLEKSSGKKLGFIGQEIGREINTLGSKAYHPELQKIVVEMKDQLEKIKEQVLNIL